MSNVYWIRQSIDDDGERPDVVTYYDPDGRFKTADGFKEFQSNACVAAGKPGYGTELWFTPDLYATERGTTPIEDWDYYACATFGAFSKRAMDALSGYFGDRFLPIPARLEGHNYCCLRCQKRIDCLDRSASEIVFFDYDPTRVMEITKYRFQKGLLADSMIFAIPELEFHLFCTEPVPASAANSDLQGFEFQLVDEDVHA